ncbi:MAG: helix-turn-helix transcriptional regulator [Herbiconiux sp.]|nr:helix-turn-helix transcriptional regulator [Herbiconiux sp.]
MADENGRIMPSAMALGNTLRAARREAGLSQAQLAELAGVSERTLRDIERGRSSVSLAAVLAVANALGLRVEARR